MTSGEFVAIVSSSMTRRPRRGVGSDAGRRSRQSDLLDTSLDRQKATAQAIDLVRAKFGSTSLVRGIALQPPGAQPRTGKRT